MSSLLLTISSISTPPSCFCRVLCCAVLAGHTLIRAAGVPARLSLIQILNHTQSEPIAAIAHDHTSTTHLLPAQCKILGRGRWFFCGLILPSIAWRVQSLLLAMEVKHVVFKGMATQALHPAESLLHRMQMYTSPAMSMTQSLSGAPGFTTASASALPLPSASVVLTGNQAPVLSTRPYHCICLCMCLL